MKDSEIISALKSLSDRWPRNRKLFANNGSLALVKPSKKSGKYIVLDVFPGIKCDGGDAWQGEKDGVEYIDVK